MESDDMKVYVLLNNDNTLKAYATYNVNGSFIEVEQDDITFNVSKMEGYYVQFKDGENHLLYDEEKYNKYSKEQQKRESIIKGEQLKQKLTEKTILNNASDEYAYVMRYLYDEWSRDGVDYKADDRLMYNDKFYKVLQDHTSQADWLPTTATSLYVEIADPSNEYPEFKQPTGAHDAYAKGDKVTFEGKKYISLMDANVYSPTDYPAGWQEVV